MKSHPVILRLSSFLAAAALLGCSMPGQKQAAPPTTAEAPVAPEPPPPAQEPPTMHATAAPSALPLPDLDQVRDEQGQPIARDSVLGHWTVLWFYPAAATPG